MEIELDENESRYLRNLLGEILTRDNHTAGSERTARGIAGKIEDAGKAQAGVPLQDFVTERIAGMLGIEGRKGGGSEIRQDGNDIVVRGKARGRFPFSVRCIDCESIALSGCVRQARNDCAWGNYWSLVAREKGMGQPPVVIMDFVAFELLMSVFLGRDHKKEHGNGQENLFRV